MVLKQMSASVCVLEVHNDQEGSGTKSEAQLRGAQLQLASGKGGTYWMDSRDLGHRNQSRFKDLSDWTQEIRSHQFSPFHLQAPKWDAVYMWHLIQSLPSALFMGI